MPSEHPAAAIEMIEAMKVMKAARGKTDADAAFTFQVATSVGALASYPFDRVDPPPPGSDNKSLALVYARALHTARGALVSINGRTLDGFQGDAAVREALDRAYTSLCSSVIRLTLMRAALGDSADTARSTAVHDLGRLVPEGGGPVLREVLRYDTYAAVRREAAKSLAAYPRLIAVPALIDGLADEMTDVRSAASRALEAISGETFGDDRAAWLKWWQMSATKTPPSKPAAPEAGK